MTNFLKTMLGIAHVTETPNTLQIGGVKTQRIGMDMMSEWSTKRIEKYMFNKFTGSLISFDKFFALDVHYMLRKMASNRYSRTGRRVLHEVLEQLENNTFLANIRKEPQKILDRTKAALFKFDPLPHQTEFFDVYEERTQRYGLKGYLLSAAPGTGKTFASLVLAEMLHASVVIMVVPKNAVYKVWERHLKEQYKVPQDSWIAADGKPYEKQRFIITHYEGLAKTVEIVNQANTSNPVVILDESHNLNNMEALRTQLFIDMCARINCNHVLWASGTPIKALGYEAIPLLRTIDPLFNRNVEERFKKIFGIDAKRALDILRNRMGIISFRVEKNETSDNTSTRHTVHVQLPDGHQYTLEAIRKEMKQFIEVKMKHYKDYFHVYEKQYEDALRIHAKKITTDQGHKAFDTYKRYIKMIRRGYDPQAMKEQSAYCNNYELKVVMPDLPQEIKPQFKSARSVVKYKELRVIGEALGGVLGKKRAQCHLEMIPHMTLPTIIDQAVKKTVIFTSYVSVVDGIRDFLKAQDYQPLIVYGETNKDLAAHVTAFETKPEANPMIATYQSLSTAVPLIVANVAVFTNQPWRDNEKIQAEARVDRLGQDTPVVFYDILLDTGKEPNISTRSKEILEWSKAQVEAILGTTVPEGSLTSMESLQEEFDDIEHAYDREQWASQFCQDNIFEEGLALEMF